MGWIAKTGKAVYESFKNPGIRVGYISTLIYAGLAAGLPRLGEDWNYPAFCAGLTGAAILICTAHVHYKLTRKYQLNFF